MNTRLFAAIAAAVGMALSAGAAAGPLPPSACSSYTTVAAWAAAGSCVDDVDGDLLVSYVSSTGLFPTGAGFQLSEIEIGGVDLYNVSFNFGDPGWLGGGGSIQYLLTSLNQERIDGANFDLITAGIGALATKALFDIGGATPFLVLTSTGGRDPPQGETSFAGRHELLVVDTFEASPGALYSHSDNSFRVVPVPEPGTVALLGLGLAGLAATRRREPS